MLNKYFQKPRNSFPKAFLNIPLLEDGLMVKESWAWNPWCLACISSTLIDRIVIRSSFWVTLESLSPNLKPWASWLGMVGTKELGALATSMLWSDEEEAIAPTGQCPGVTNWSSSMIWGSEEEPSFGPMVQIEDRGESGTSCTKTTFGQLCLGTDPLVGTFFHF